MDTIQREIVLDAIQEACHWRKWSLLAVHVRSNHVHAVVDADRSPEQVMTAFKAYASRMLNGSLLDPPGLTRWARHGSTRYLRDADEISAAVGYVVSGQGEDMAVYDQAAEERPERGEAFPGPRCPG
jgi:REP element-mobilizing transposase RayT